MGKKIGRNDLCHCGSGKKYKKCCLTSDGVPSIKNEMQTGSLINSNDFPYIARNENTIRSIFSEYNYLDLVMAVYCINISLNNRSALENSMTLNAGLILQDKFGSKRISNYEEFRKFFERLKFKLPISWRDDYTIEDFGEVKLFWEGKVYNVIIGTGHNQVFALYQFLPYLVEVKKLEIKFGEILSYFSDTIQYFKNVNISNNDETVKYTLPSEILFDKVKEFFEQKLDLYPLEMISSILENVDFPIEKRHFVHSEDKILPLYNTSILVDLYSIWIKELDEKQEHDLVNFTIYRMLTELCNMDDKNNPKVLYPVSIIENHKYISKTPYTFCAVTDNTAIIAINEEEYSNNDLQIELEKIEILHKSNRLDISEVKSRDKNIIGMHIPDNHNISIILYNQFTNITEHAIRLGEKNEKYLKCSALDMIYFLSFIDDFEELANYIEFKNSSQEYEQMFGFGGEASRFLMWKQQNHMFSKGAIKYGMISIGHDTDTSYVWEYYKDYLQGYPWESDKFMFGNPFAWNIKPLKEGYYQYVNKLSHGYGGIIKTFSNNCALFFIHNIEFYKLINMTEMELEIISFVDDINDRKIKRCEKIFEKSIELTDTCIQVLYMPMEYAKTVDNTGFTTDLKRKYVYSDLHIYKKSICIRYAINSEKLYKDIQQAEDRSVETEYFLELFKPLEKIDKIDYLALASCLIKEREFKKEVDVFSMSIDYYWSDKIVKYDIANIAFLEVRKEIAELCYKLEIEPGNYNGRGATTIVRKMQQNLIHVFENEVIKYDKNDLHIRLLSIYAGLIHSVGIHKKRYNAFNNLDEDISVEINKKVVNMREDDKHHIRCLQYLLETNLNLERNNIQKCTKEEIQYLMAFSNWLVVLQDNSDLCFNSENDSHIEITYEYLINVIAEDEMETQKSILEKRIYDNQDYSIKGDDEDIKYIEAAIDAFGNDTDIDFKDMLALIEFLQLNFYDYEHIELAPNVIKMEVKQIIQGFQECLENEITEEEGISLLDFITVDNVKLKLWRGKIDFFLPINCECQRISLPLADEFVCHTASQIVCQLS